MDFRKKTQNSNQKPQSFRRMDGVFTYAEIKKRRISMGKMSFSPGKNIDLQQKIFSNKNIVFRKIAAPCFLSKNGKNNTRKTFTIREIFNFFVKATLTQPAFAKRIVSFVLILAVVSGVFFQNSNKAQSATYTWQQSSWVGGQTSNSDVHPGKVGGWDEYSSKDSFVEMRDSGNEVGLAWTDGSTVQTSDNGIQDTPNVGGFNAGTKISTRVRGSADLGRIDLSFAGVSYVATGKTHSLAIKSDNTLWAWG